MTKTTKAATPKKTVGQKIDKKIEAVAKIDDIIIEEATQPVGTITLKRWQAALMAAAVALAILVIVF